MTERIKDSDSRHAASSATDGALFLDAYKNGHSTTVKGLVLGGKADLVTEKMILDSCSEGNLDMVKALTACKSGGELNDYRICSALTNQRCLDPVSWRPKQAHADILNYLDERFGMCPKSIAHCTVLALWGGHSYISKYLLAHSKNSGDLVDARGKTNLHDSVYFLDCWDENDHERTVREVLSHKVNVDAQDENGDTALTIMILQADQNDETTIAKIARILVEEGGADISVVNRNGCNAVALAVCKNFHRLAEYLQAQGATLPKTALLYFVIQKRWDLVHRFLEDPELGADVNYCGRIKVPKAKMEHGIDLGRTKEMEHGSTLLMAAAQQDNVDEIRWLLAQGADGTVLNDANQNALHFASSKEACSLLINAGANAHVPDKGGNTPLLCAIRSLRPEPAEEWIGIIEVLVDEGRANVNHVDKQGDGVLNLICSPRFGAPRNDSDSSAIVKNLLERGLEVVDTKGDRALVAAATQPDGGMMINTVRVLVEARMGQGGIPRLSGQPATNKTKKRKMDGKEIVVGRYDDCGSVLVEVFDF